MEIIIYKGCGLVCIKILGVMRLRPWFFEDIFLAFFRAQVLLAEYFVACGVSLTIVHGG